MPALSPSDLDRVRSHPQRVKRYVSVAPRTVLFQTQVESVTTDGATGGIVALDWTGTLAGTWEAVGAGLTVDVGTTPGAHDVGQLRVRKAATATTLVVAEEAPGHTPIAAGHYLTVRDEYRIWTRLNLLREVSTGGAIQSFVEYKDYDVAFTTGYAALPPLANIDLKPAGFVDAGQTYRTVQLSASRSAAVHPEAALVGVLWDIADGTLVEGTLGDAEIAVRFPAATTFRHVSLQVLDSNGVSSVAYRGVWVHDAEHPPLTVLRVGRDSRGLGREMEFTFFGRATDASETVIPEGATICYWELAAFGPAASAPPAGYIDQFVGWMMHDVVLHAPRSTYTLSVAGPHYWLDQITGPQYRLNRTVVPAAWTDLPLLSPDMIVYTLLRWHSTALDVCSLILSGVANEWLKPSIAKASLWQQITSELNATMSRARCDSLGAIWLRQRANFLTTDERTARGVTCTLGAESRRATEGVSIATDFGEPVGLVVGSGFAFEVGMKSYAPGDTPGLGSTVEMPTQALAPVAPQAYLNRIAGDYLADANNPRPDETIRLLGNLDIVEPAWDEFAQFALPADGNLRGQDLSAHRWTVERVEVNHVGDQKQITWTIVQETQGIPGKTVPIEENAVSTPTDYSPAQSGTSEQPELAPELLPDGEAFALLTSGGVLLTCNDWSAGPTWALGLDLASAGLHGDLLSFSPDAFSPGYVGGGSDVNVKLATTLRVEDLDDVFGSPGLTSRHTFAVEAARRIIKSERGVPDFFAVSTVDGDGVRLAVTTDGVGWSEATVSSVVPTSEGGTPVLMDPVAGYDTIFSEGVVQSGSYIKPANDWERFGFSWNRNFEVIGCIFTYTLTGGGGVLKRMSPNESLGGVLPSMWGDTSDNLGTGTYVAVKQYGYGGYTASQIRDALAPGATLIGGGDLPGDGHVCPVPINTTFWTGFNQGWSEASTFDFTIELIGYSASPPSGGGDGLATPTLFVSGKQAGKLMLGAYVDDGDVVGALFESDDYGASTAQSSLPAVDFGIALGGHLHVPWDGDDRLCYWNKATAGANQAHRTELGGLAIAPLGTAGGPVGDRAFDSNPNNRQHVAMVEVRSDGTRRVAVSRYGGAPGTWQALTGWLSPDACYIGVAISGSDTLYMFGSAGIAIAPNLGPDVIDKTGTLYDDFPAAGVVLGILGGPISG